MIDYGCIRTSCAVCYTVCSIGHLDWECTLVLFVYGCIRVIDTVCNIPIYVCVDSLWNYTCVCTLVVLVYGCIRVIDSVCDIGHLDWRPTFLTLTADFVGFGKVGDSTLTEYILLEEV